MRDSLLFILLGCLLLTGCGPKVSPELEADIQALKKDVSSMEARHEAALMELRETQDQLDASTDNLNKEKQNLLAELSRLESEVSKPLPTPEPPPPSTADFLDEITMVSGNTVSAEVKEIHDGEIVIFHQGDEHTGQLDGVERIRFRSVEPEEL